MLAPEPLGSVTYRAIVWLACLEVLFIVYGSLLPFEYRDVPLAAAIENFKHLQWIDVGETGRSDLIANLVLYLPFGFLACAALARRNVVFGAIAAFGLGVMLAIGVEFVQTWAAPRTVSLNDITTEILGTLLGIVLWIVWGKALIAAVQRTIQGGQEAVQAAFGLYVLVYVLVSLFPFDFFVSIAEIRERLHQPDFIVWTTQDHFSLRGVAGLILRTVIGVPLGVFTNLVSGRSLSTAVRRAVYLAGLVELLHLFEVSYRFDVPNIVVAGFGAALGHRLANSAIQIPLRMARGVRSGRYLFVLAYLAAVASLRGWRLNYAGLAQIEDTLAHVNWLPFYYHYYVSEGAALASTVAITLAYLPIGVFCWAMQFRTDRSMLHPYPVWPSAITACIVAAGIEAGALITANLRPDPTNLLIAMLAAVLGQRSWEWIVRVAQEMRLRALRVQ